MSVHRWALVVGVAAVIAGQPGVSGADSLPELALAPNPAPIHTSVTVSNTPGGECGVEEAVGSVSALVTFTTPQGDQVRIFTLPREDGRWSIEFTQTDEIGRYDVSAICERGVPPHATVVPPSGVTNRVDFAYADGSFEVVESLPTTVATIDDTTPTVAPPTQPVITATAPTFTG